MIPNICSIVKCKDLSVDGLDEMCSRNTMARPEIGPCHSGRHSAVRYCLDRRKLIHHPLPPCIVTDMSNRYPPAPQHLLLDDRDVFIQDIHTKAGSSACSDACSVKDLVAK
jgi:hypothetical protein